MSWFEQAVFYHIYPLGLTGAPRQNPHAAPVHRLWELESWVRHLAELGCTALYVGPLFESAGHGYETEDYRRLDSRLGDNGDLRSLVALCHGLGVRVILDAVFNHTGRDFFAFRDLLEKREASPCRDWYRVDFGGDNGYHDGLRYECWGGYELLPRLNLQNPEVVQYHLDTVRFWVEEFDVDGLRLDAADQLDFGFLRALRAAAEGLKPEFWLMGEVIHGDYSRWVSDAMLHSVTNYRLHKALYSSHNDHNYFELAHTVEQLGPLCPRLYTFADNHDTERIQTRLRRKADYLPLHALLFALPGIPSVYYGSEFALEGRKEGGSDDALRPALRLEDFRDEPHAGLIRLLARARRDEPALYRGSYARLLLTTEHFAFARRDGDREVLAAANNGDGPARLRLPARLARYRALLGGQTLTAENGWVQLELEPHGAELLLPAEPGPEAERAPIPAPAAWKAALKDALRAAPAPAPEAPGPAPDPAKPLEELSVPELQALILQRLAANGPLTERMRREVAENVYPESLRSWARSFQR